MRLPAIFLAIVIISALAACGGSSNAPVGSTAYSAEWAAGQLQPLQSSFSSAFNNKDWGAIYDLYADPNVAGLCPKQTFTIGIIPAVVSMGATELARIIAAMVHPPTDGRLLSANDTVITWALTGPNNAVSSAAATKVNGRWLFDGAGPCADFIG